MSRANTEELGRAVGYLANETHRFESQVLADVEVTTLPTGDAPDAQLCAVVRAERERVRAFARVVDQHARRIRGGR